MTDDVTSTQVVEPFTRASVIECRWLNRRQCLSILHIRRYMLRTQIKKTDGENPLLELPIWQLNIKKQYICKINHTLCADEHTPCDADGAGVIIV